MSDFNKPTIIEGLQARAHRLGEKAFDISYYADTVAPVALGATLAAVTVMHIAQNMPFINL